MHVQVYLNAKPKPRIHFRIAGFAALVISVVLFILFAKAVVPQDGIGIFICFLSSGFFVAAILLLLASFRKNSDIYSNFAVVNGEELYHVFTTTPNSVTKYQLLGMTYAERKNEFVNDYQRKAIDKLEEGKLEEYIIGIFNGSSLRDGLFDVRRMYEPHFVRTEKKIPIIAYKDRADRPFEAALLELNTGCDAVRELVRKSEMQIKISRNAG